MSTNELAQYGSSNTKDEEGLLPNSTRKVDSKKYKYVLYGLIIAATIIVGLIIGFIVYAVESDSSSSSITTAKCQTDGCHKLASDILQSINTSVDPCDSFYNYVCDGWKEENIWKLIKVPQAATAPDELDTKQKEVFLSVLTGNNDPLQNYDGVAKAKLFFHSCYNSDITEEDLQSQQLLQTFINMVNFSDFNINNINTSNINDEQWTVNNSIGFQNAMSWMLRREWDELFRLVAYDEGILRIMQNLQWIHYNITQWQSKMEHTFIPLFQSQFGLTIEQAQFVADLVINFTVQIANITTDQRNTYITNTTIDEIYNLFGSSNINVLDYVQIMTDLFYCSSQDCINAVIYYEPGVAYFNALVDLIESTPPFVVQYWLFIDVLDKFFNFGIDQSRFEDRRDFCFNKVKYEFPYIYGFIIFQKMYGNDKYELALNITKRVKDDGVVELMKRVDWLDESSLNNSLLKANNMDSYVGLPPQMTNITQINKYYDDESVNNISDTNGFVKNYEMMLEFDIAVRTRIFDGDEVLLHLPWPAEFQSLVYRHLWLTGVNAFYRAVSIAGEKGNWFCMPQTITQNPIFDMEFPMLVNFAALGRVVGHEISHGFDIVGSRFNWYGDEVEMWTNATRSAYNERMDCFIEQYSNIEVEPDIFCDGNITFALQQNAADNGGMAATINAYQIYKRKFESSDSESSESSEDMRPLLPGLEFTENQIWWISYARTWCDVFRPGIYDTNCYTYGVPRVLRVNGVAQNFQQFADAFNCHVGSPMNPERKCGLWHNP